MLRSMARRSKEAQTPLLCGYHSLWTGFLGEEPSKAFPPGKHIPELTGGGSVGQIRLEVTSPPLREHGRLGSLRAPLPKPGRRGKGEPRAGAGDGKQGWESAPARGSTGNNAAERGAAGLPRPRNPGTPAVRAQAWRPGPAGRRRPPQPPARLARPQPAYLLCWGSVHGACSRNGPA